MQTKANPCRSAAFVPAGILIVAVESRQRQRSRQWRGYATRSARGMLRPVSTARMTAAAEAALAASGYETAAKQKTHSLVN